MLLLYHLKAEKKVICPFKHFLCVIYLWKIISARNPFRRGNILFFICLRLYHPLLFISSREFGFVSSITSNETQKQTTFPSLMSIWNKCLFFFLKALAVKEEKEFCLSTAAQRFLELLTLLAEGTGLLTHTSSKRISGWETPRKINDSFSLWNVFKSQYQITWPYLN